MQISIVTISFNQAQFLGRAIDSILDQDYADLDYVVVDPGSKDDSRAIIDGYGSRITRKLFEPDNGPADGLNKGFAATTGEILGFLNSDDTLLPGSLAAVADYFRDHPDVDVVSGHALVTDGEDRVVRKSYSDRYSLRAVAYRAAIILQPATFFRRSAYERAGGFNVANRCAWDGELWIDMARAGARFGLMERFLGTYRLHEASITGSAKLEALSREYYARTFGTIIGKPAPARDAILRRMYKLRRQVLNYRETFERIRRGPIYGRCATPKAA